MAFEFQPYENRSLGHILELMLAPARARAAGAREAAAARAREMEVRGQIGAQLAGSLGSIASGALQQYAQQQADAPRREMEQLQLQAARRESQGAESEAARAQAMDELLSRNEPVAPQEWMRIAGPEKGLAIIRGLEALRGDNKKRYADTQTILRDVLRGMDSLPEPVRAKHYQTVRENLITRGVIEENDAPPDYSPEFWATTVNFGQAPKQPEGFTLSPGETRFGPDGKPIASLDPKPEKGPAVGSFEDYVLRRFGQSPTPEQITQARKDYQQADDRPPRVNVTLSPAMESNVINRLTTQWTNATKPAADLSRQIKMMDAGLEAARRGDLAQGAQAVLITFQKILDPTSVVRESEYARSAAGLALDDRVKGAVERLAKGGAGVPLTELEKFANLAREAVKKQTTGYTEAIKERIGRQADHFKIPRELVFEDFNFAQAAEAPQPNASGQRPAGRVYYDADGNPIQR